MHIIVTCMPIRTSGLKWSSIGSKPGPRKLLLLLFFVTHTNYNYIQAAWDGSLVPAYLIIRVCVKIKTQREKVITTLLYA